MFIGKEAELPPGALLELPYERTEKSWLLILAPRGGNLLGNIGGLRCTLPNVKSIALILADSEEGFRKKLLTLGHEGVPVVLKTGDKVELCQLAKTLSFFVCSCNFKLLVAPSSV